MFYSHDKKSKAFLGSIKVKKAYIGTQRVYSAGNIVTYYVDTKDKYEEEVDSDASCLSPTSFTPTKSGWEFVGWRKDKVANESTETSVIMGDDPITLYAVFKQDVKLTYDGNGSTDGSVSPETKKRYYNNETINDPVFKLKSNNFTRKGYTFSKWDLGTVGTDVKLSASTTTKAQWTDNAWTWVKDYIGSGATLTIDITDADNAQFLKTGDKLSRFDVASVHDDGSKAMSIDFRTNSVSTKGCRTMTITFPDFLFKRNNDGVVRDYLRIMSTSSSTPLIEWNTERTYGGTYTVDVSSASEVYIVCCMGAWGHTESPVARIQGISFSN